MRQISDGHRPCRISETRWCWRRVALERGRGVAPDGAQVWLVMYILCAVDSSDHIGVHGGLDARRGAGSIRSAIGTRPTGAAHGDGERDRRRVAFESHPRNGSGSPQPARMAGEARADRRRRLGPRPARGTLQSSSAASVFRCIRRQSSRTTGLMSAQASLCASTALNHGRKRAAGSGADVGAVGATAERAPCVRRDLRTAFRGQRSARVERGAQPGDEAKFIEAVTAPRCVPQGRVEDLAPEIPETLTPSHRRRFIPSRREGDVAGARGDDGTSVAASEGDVRSTLRVGEGDVRSIAGVGEGDVAGDVRGDVHQDHGKSPGNSSRPERWRTGGRAGSTRTGRPQPARRDSRRLDPATGGPQARSPNPVRRRLGDPVGTAFRPPLCR